jgi:hypothetical protein
MTRALASIAIAAGAPPRAALAAVLMAVVLTFAGGALGQILGEGQRPPAEANSQLFEAVFNNDLDSVKLSIAEGADIEARSKLGRNALELAVDLGHFEVAHYLLALRHHKRAQVARSQPPKPAAPPPFVPAAPPPAQVPPAPSPAPVVAAAPPPPPVPQTPPSPPQPPAEPVQVVTSVAPPVPAPAPAPEPAPSVVKEEAPATPEAPAKARVAVAAAAPSPPRAPAFAAGAPLDVSLRLGLAATSATAAGDEPCVDKKKGLVRLCVLPVEWPEELEEHFRIESFLYRGVKALARFEGGVATRLYAQFPADSFAAVADFHRQRLGPPQEVIERQVRLAGGDKATNQVLVWKLGGGGGRVNVVEIRSFDDVRRSTASSGYGAIQAYYEGARSMFSQVSALDLMRLR